MKEEKVGKQTLNAGSDISRGCGKRGALPTSNSTIHEEMPVTSNIACSSSSTLVAGGQCLSQVAHVLRNVNSDDLNIFDNPNRAITIAHNPYSMNRKSICAIQGEQSRTRPENKPDPLKLRRDLFESQPANSPVLSPETPGRCRPVFSGLGSLSMFMQTRGAGEFNQL